MLMELTPDWYGYSVKQVKRDAVEGGGRGKVANPAKPSHKNSLIPGGKENQQVIVSLRGTGTNLYFKTAQ